MQALENGGEIQSDFAELKVNNDEHESRASGSVGERSFHIVINNEHEGIGIRKASATPPAPPVPPNPGKATKAIPEPKGAPEPTDNSGKKLGFKVSKFQGPEVSRRSGASVILSS